MDIKAGRYDTVPLLDEMPDLPFPVSHYYDAFNHLSNSRQTGYGTEQPLTFSEIDKYSSRMGFDADFRFFYRVMREMDTVYRKHQSAEREKEAAKNKTKGSAPPKKAPRKR